MGEVTTISEELDWPSCADWVSTALVISLGLKAKSGIALGSKG
jgi:hypothetical protein